MQNYTQSGYMAERVLTASPMELIQMLYEGALRSVDVAIEKFRTNDIVERGRAITKAVDFIGELRSSLRDVNQSEYTSRLAELYAYMQNRLLAAHARKSEVGLVEVSKLLKTLYEGWLDLMKNVGDASADTECTPAKLNLVPSSPYEMSLDSPSSGRSWSI